MTAAVVGLVLLVLVMAFGMLASGGAVDPLTFLLFILGLVFGVIAIRVAHKSEIGAVEPKRCPHCGGLNSPSAPYCKHCKKPVTEEIR